MPPSGSATAEDSYMIASNSSQDFGFRNPLNFLPLDIEMVFVVHF